jgi:hypothetical protein
VQGKQKLPILYLICATDVIIPEPKCFIPGTSIIPVGGIIENDVEYIIWISRRRNKNH